MPAPLLHDGLDGLRARLEEGEPLERALAAERAVVLSEKAALAREVAAQAERERSALSGKRKSAHRRGEASGKHRRARTAG